MVRINPVYFNYPGLNCLQKFDDLKKMDEKEKIELSKQNFESTLILQSTTCLNKEIDIIDFKSLCNTSYPL